MGNNSHLAIQVTNLRYNNLDITQHSNQAILSSNQPTPPNKQPTLPNIKQHTLPNNQPTLPNNQPTLPNNHPPTLFSSQATLSQLHTTPHHHLPLWSYMRRWWSGTDQGLGLVLVWPWLLVL